LWRGSEFITTHDEATMYRALGLDTIPAELREGRGEIEAAAAGSLPDLVQAGDLKGLLHCHTTMSDGANTIEELALAARDAGFQYLGVTDHSQSATLAGGLDPDLIRDQAETIDALNERLDGFRVLKGIEADILVDGSLDYESDVLAGLDFVIGSIHSRFNMSREHMTGRLLSAMDNPYLNIIGHPTGRLLMARNPYPLDLDAVFAKAAATGVALEINADPHRLDLDWRLAARAREAGADITIGVDAHGVAGLANVRFGIDMARKAWLTAERIANTKSATEFVAWAKRRRPRAGG
jgi:DNA polymerase (family 10)